LGRRARRSWDAAGRRGRLADGTRSTTSGWSRDASSRASVAARGLGVREVIGAEKTRLASRPQVGQRADPVAVPIGIDRSKMPQSRQRYW
jgi:hypothetical protein